MYRASDDVLSKKSDFNMTRVLVHMNIYYNKSVRKGVGT